MKQEITIIIAVLCFGLQSYAKQEIQKEVESDSLSNKTYKQLQNSLIKNIQDSIKSTSYAIAILKKGKKERDTIQILNGFFFLSTINENNENVLSYSDSIIKISKKVNNSRFLGMSFLNKGVYFYEKREFDKSLDNFLTAKLYVDSLPRLNYITEYSIGLLKSRVGEYQEALEIFKKSWMYANERNFKEKDNDNYLITLLSLADGYGKVGKNDSASFYNRLGVEESLFSGNDVKYYDFVLNEGINKYYLKKYDVSYDSISKVIKNFRMQIDRPNLILAYYYYAKTLLEKEEIDSAIVNFKKVDSLFNITNDIHPKSRETYEFLINYYKSKNDDKNQLLYIERLLKVDSILNNNYKYLSKKLAREYDTPKLLKEKERVISGLENKNVKVANQLMLVSILLGLSLLGLIYYYTRQKTLKRRFNEVMNSKIEHNSEKTTANSGAIGISSDIVNDVLQRLEQFENSDAFLNPSITINDLSKQFDTNSKYLSKIINTYKNKNFSNYINDLRINCVVEKLKLDRKFRNYTVKAIGSEVGFNTTQAFSKAFYKSTGIHPSYFVKKIGEITNEEM